MKFNGELVGVSESFGLLAELMLAAPFSSWGDKLNERYLTGKNDGIFDGEWLGKLDGALVGTSDGDSETVRLVEEWLGEIGSGGSMSSFLLIRSTRWFDARRFTESETKDSGTEETADALVADFATQVSKMQKRFLLIVDRMLEYKGSLMAECKNQRL